MPAHRIDFLLHAASPKRFSDHALDEERGQRRLEKGNRPEPGDDQEACDDAHVAAHLHAGELGETHARGRDQRKVQRVADEITAVTLRPQNDAADRDDNHEHSERHQHAPDLEVHERALASHRQSAASASALSSSPSALPSPRSCASAMPASSHSRASALALGFGQHLPDHEVHRKVALVFRAELYEDGERFVERDRLSDTPCRARRTRTNRRCRSARLARERRDACSLQAFSGMLTSTALEIAREDSARAVRAEARNDDRRRAALRRARPRRARSAGGARGPPGEGRPRRRSVAPRPRSTMRVPGAST